MHIEQVHARLTLALLAAALGGTCAASGASVFWEPYGYDTATVALFHCDAAAQPTAADAALDDLLAGGAPTDLPPPPGAAPSVRALANAHPIGPAASLTGDAAQVEAGRFGGGVRLASPAAAIGFRGGSARGTTEFWLKAEALPAEPTPVLHWRSAADTEGLRLLLHPDGTLEPRLAGDSFGRTSWRLGPGRWTHLALSADWAFEFSGLLRLHADGVPLLEAEPRWDYRVVNRLAALNELRVGGVSGWLDELRISKSVRAYYPYDLGWEDVANERPSAAGRPFCRDPADLALRLSFDRRLDADPAPPGLTVTETSLRVKGLGESKASQGFGDGVSADALLLGPNMPQPAYAAPALLSSEAGTIAFWLRPLNWDNFTRVDHRREASRVRRLTLFRVFGEKPAAIRRFRPMRGNDPSLLALLIDITPDADQAAPPPLHPGVWNHIAITWQGTTKRLYINGRSSAFAGIEAATHGWWRANDEETRGEIFAGSVPDRLAFDGRADDARTLLDDLRLYNRPLSPPEAANLARAPDRRQAPLPLPDLYAEFGYNGVTGTAEAHATPLLPAYSHVTRFSLTLLREGEAKPLAAAEAPCPADGSLAALTLKTAPFGFGAYRLRLDALDAAGAVLATTNHLFSRTQPPWWQTDAGRSDAVMPGWTPLAVADNALRVTGREIRLGASGLPASIRSAGGELLAAPVTLHAAAGGTPLPLTPQAPPVLNCESERRATAHATLAGAGLTVRTALEADFDGMLWYTLTLEPSDAARPPALDQFELRIPLAPANAELCHWSSAQREFRDPAVNWIGELPPGDGVLLRSNDFARWRRIAGLRGSFHPYVLLTGMARGLAWFAENDRGWTQHDHVPAVSVERHGGAVTLVLRIVAQPLTLDTPRVIAFGLHPTPFKALDPDWRRCPAWDGTTPDTFAGNNLKGGPDTVFWLYPEGGDWEAVRRRLDGEGATQRIVARAAAQNHAFAARYGRPPRPRESHVPALYWDMQWVGGFPPHCREWAERWHPDFTYYLPEFVDFSVWAWREWIRNTGKTVAGIYLDDCWPVPSKLDWSPVTHTLADGHVQPGWQWRGWRERMMRTRQVFHDEGLPPKFCAHTTHTPFAPYHSFFDYFLDGEDHYASPPGQRDFIDSWPLARLRFAHAAKWGVATGWLGWCGNSTPTEKYPAWTFRQQRAYTALIALHDIVWPFADGLEATFNLREPDTVFIPYWEDRGLARHNHSALKVAAWRRPGQCLVLLANIGDERLEAEVRLDPATMGFAKAAGALQAADVDASLLTYFAEDATTVKPPAIGDDPLAAEALDLERDPASIPLAERRAADPDGRFEWRDGLLRCPVRRHDYRLFLFQ